MIRAIKRQLEIFWAYRELDASLFASADYFLSLYAPALFLYLFHPCCEAKTRFQKASSFLTPFLVIVCDYTFPTICATGRKIITCNKLEMRVCPQVTAVSRLWCSSPDSFSAPSWSIWCACRRRCSRLTATQVSAKSPRLITAPTAKLAHLTACVRMNKKTARAGDKKLLWCQPSLRRWNFSGALNGARFGCIREVNWIVCVACGGNFVFSLYLLSMCGSWPLPPFPLWESELQGNNFPVIYDKIISELGFSLFLIL